MTYRQLWILIEGNDDERFFQLIVKPKLEEKYGAVGLWKYAHEPPKRVDKFLISINKMGADYIYVTDINLAPCVTAKKQDKQEIYKNIDTDKVIVVKREIESWYLAGLDETTCKKLGLPPCRTTDSIGKEEFNSFKPKKFDSRIAFMVEILRCFSIEVAKQKNGSFRYFAAKYCC